MKKKFEINEKGQSMTELAISLVFMFILLAGAIDLGRAFMTYIALRDAAQEGAIFASVSRTKKTESFHCTDIVNRIRQSSTNPIVDLTDTSDIAVTVLFNGTACASLTSNSDACFGQEVQVTVTYGSFPITTPFLGTFVGQTFPIRATIRDTVITPPCH